MDYQFLGLRLEPPLARITLSRASDGNRVGQRAVRELVEAAETIADSPEIRAVLLSAEGKDFCLGWADDTFAEGFLLPPDPFGVIARLPQPVVCAIRGGAISAGLEIALVADVRICEEGALFGLPETAQGQLPRGGGTQRLSRLAGRGVALAMLLASEELDAQAAHRAGLVAMVVPDGELESRAESIVENIAAKGPIATKFAKEAISRGLDLSLEQALRYETDLTVILQTTADRAEGVRAFVEKRTPHFEGK